MATATSEEIQENIYTLDAKFQKACSQVVLLNNLVQELQTRYERAVKANLRTYRYTLRLRLCTVEGLRNMFYEYASATADKIDGLENDMRSMGTQPARIYPQYPTDSDSEPSDTMELE